MRDRISETSKSVEETLGQTVFIHTEHDKLAKLASSIEDSLFLKLMDKEMNQQLGGSTPIQASQTTLV